MPRPECRYRKSDWRDINDFRGCTFRIAHNSRSDKACGAECMPIAGQQSDVKQHKNRRPSVLFVPCETAEPH